MTGSLSAGRIRLARVIAVAADLAQIVVFPAFVGGGFSPVNDGLDLVIAAVLTVLVGWHWAFLPTFLVELVPVVDLFPTWTTAVFFATRAGAPPAPPGPAAGRPPGAPRQVIDVTPISRGD
jgi:hypothetical protein